MVLPPPFFFLLTLTSPLSYYSFYTIPLAWGFLSPLTVPLLHQFLTPFLVPFESSSSFVFPTVQRLCVPLLECGSSLQLCRTGGVLSLLSFQLEQVHVCSSFPRYETSLHRSDMEPTAYYFYPAISFNVRCQVF